MIKFGSICSGIEAASVAFHPLGWQPLFFAETDKQASAVLKHRWPGVPNLGNMEKIDGTKQADADVLIGGTPCQSFSLAGKRAGLSDARGNLALSYVRLAHAIQSVRQRKRKRGLVVIWENVEGVLSMADNAFGCLLSGFVGCPAPIVSPLDKGRWPDAGLVAGSLARAAFRVFDAQYFGLAQRRSRVLVVVSFGNGPDPCKILFEPSRVPGNPAPRREARKEPAPGAEGSSGIGSVPEVSYALKASSGGDAGKGAHERVFIPQVSGPLYSLNERGGQRTTDLEGHGALIPEVAWALQHRDAKGVDSDTKEGHLIPVAFTSKDHGQDALEDIAPTMRAMGHDGSRPNGGGQLAVAFKPSHYTRGKDGAPSELAPPLSADADKGDQEPVIFQSRIARNGRGQPERGIAPTLQGANAGATSDMRPLLAQPMGVRRLLPVECERLQGFEDDYTLVPWGNGMASDSARYRQLGNSMPVPMIRWVGERIMAEIGDA